MVIFFAVSAVVIANSIFFGVYLFSLRKKSISNLFLSLLLFALAIRIGKSVVALVFKNAPEIIPALGLVGMATIGPLLFLYLESLTNYQWRKMYFMHFIPSAILGIVIPLVEDNIIFYLYQFVVAQILVYLLISIFLVKKEGFSKKKSKWANGLLAGVGLMWISFLIQLVWDYYTAYFIATSIAAIVLYVLSYEAMKRQKIFGKNELNRLDKRNLEELSVDIRSLFEEQKVHLDFEITILKVAKLLRVQPYLISKVINNEFEQTFPEFVNEYRIKEVKEKLGDPSKSHLSIESIAYESGFVTSSAFYSTFKRATGKTPGQFRRNM